MATIFLVGAAQAATGVTAGAALTTTQLVWTSVATVLGSYIDSTVILPGLIGGRDQGSAGSTGIQSLSEGDPFRFAIGPECRMPGFLAWQPKELEVEENDVQEGKGGPSQTRFSYYTSGLWLFTRTPEGLPGGINGVPQVWLDSKLRFKEGGNQFRARSDGYRIDWALAYSTTDTTGLIEFRYWWLEVVGNTPDVPAGTAADEYYFDDFIVGQDATVVQAADSTLDGAYEVVARGRKEDGSPFIRLWKPGGAAFSTNTGIPDPTPLDPAHDTGATLPILVVFQVTAPTDEGLAEQFLVRNGTRNHNVPSVIEDVEGPSSSPAWNSWSQLLIQRLALFDFGNRLPNVEGLVRTDPDPVPVGEAIRRILVEYHNLDDSEVDVSQIPETLVTRGYWWTAPYDAHRLLQPLLIAYDLVWAEEGGALRFIPRTALPEVTITTADLGATQDSQFSTNPKVEVIDESDFRQVREVTITYTDPDANYGVGEQTFARPDLREGETQRLNFNRLTLTSDEARAIATRVVWQANSFRQQVQFELSPRFAELTAGTIINLSTSERQWRIMLKEMQVGEDGRLLCTGYHDDGTADLLPALATDTSGASGTRGISYTPPSMIPLAIECGPLIDAHANDPATYLATCAGSDAADYRGATWFRRRTSETAFEQISSVPAEAILGRLLTELPEQSADFVWEDGTSIDIEIYHGLLVTVTETAQLQGQAQFYVNGEVFSVSDVELVAPIPENATTGIYRCTGRFLRGLRGTEDKIAAHDVGSQVAFLRYQLFHRDVLLASEVGLGFGYKAVSSGGDLDFFEEFFTVPAQGRTARPFSPAHFSGVAVADPQAAVPWVTSTTYAVGDEVTNGTSQQVYRCILAHTASATSEPGVGATWPTFWDVATNTQVLLTWARRSRLKIDVLPDGDSPTAEPEERYRLEIFQGTGGTTPVRVIEPLFQPRYDYTHDQRVADGNLGDFRAKVYQRGSVALGLPAEATMPNNV